MQYKLFINYLYKKNHKIILFKPSPTANNNITSNIDYDENLRFKRAYVHLQAPFPNYTLQNFNWKNRGLLSNTILDILYR